MDQSRCWGKSSSNPARDGDVPVVPTEAAPPGQAAPAAPSQERDFGLRSAPPTSLPPSEGKGRSSTSIPRFKWLQPEYTRNTQSIFFLDRNVLGIPTEPLRNPIQMPKK